MAHATITNVEPTVTLTKAETDAQGTIHLHVDAATGVTTIRVEHGPKTTSFEHEPTYLVG